jgi:hypothetical protein
MLIPLRYDARNAIIIINSLPTGVAFVTVTTVIKYNKSTLENLHANASSKILTENFLN